MKKRIFTLLMTFTMIVCSMIVFSGCKDNPEVFTTTNIASNGNGVVVKDNVLYYINGTTENRTDGGADLQQSAIYKMNLDADGNPIEGATKVYAINAGVAGSQLYCFGDYLYFATPSTSKNSSGQTISNRTNFSRVKIDGTGYQVLYTSKTDKEIEYSYYLLDENSLYLVLLEENDLVSVKIGQKCKVETLAEDIISAVFADGNNTANATEQYIYYSKEPENASVGQNANDIFMIKPNEKEPTLLSAGKVITLLEVKAGYLYFLEDEVTYKTTAINGLTRTDVVSYIKYDEFILTVDGGIVAHDKDSKKIYYYKWTEGVLQSKQLFDNKDEYQLAFANGNHLYMLDEDKLIYRITLTDENQTAIKLTADKSDIIGNYLDYEVYGNTLYFYAKNTTLLDSSEKVRNILVFKYVKM